MREDGSHVVKRISLLRDRQNEWSEETANPVPEAVGEEHGSSDVDRRPFRHIHGERCLKTSNAYAREQFGSSPVAPVAREGLNYERLLTR